MEHIIRQEVYGFIINNFIFDESEWNIKDDESLLDNGIIDSTGVLELVAHIEETYEIKVEDEDIVPENLDSIVNITQFIIRKVSEIEKAHSVQSQ